ELLPNEGGGPVESPAVRRVVEPAARARRVGERDDSPPLHLVALADTGREGREPEQPPQCEAPDRDDQTWPQQLELPFPPERAELLFARRRCPVAAARGGPAGITPCDRGAVEGCVEVVLVELQPAAQCPACAAAPRQPLLSFDHAGRLAEQICAL